VPFFPQVGPARLSGWNARQVFPPVRARPPAFLPPRLLDTFFLPSQVFWKPPSSRLLQLSAPRTPFRRALRGTGQSPLQVFAFLFDVINISLACLKFPPCSSFSEPMTPPTPPTSLQPEMIGRCSFQPLRPFRSAFRRGRKEEPAST